jgi:hypothetical protein
MEYELYAILYFTKGRPRTFNRVRLPIPACRHCGKDIRDYGGHRKYLNPRGLNLTDFWEDTAAAHHRRFKARWHVNELKQVIRSVYRGLDRPRRCDPGPRRLDLRSGRTAGAVGLHAPHPGRTGPCSSPPSPSSCSSDDPIALEAALAAPL